MRKFLLTKYSLAVLGVGGLALPAQAQQSATATATSVITTQASPQASKLNWAEATFNELYLQFGTAPKGAKVLKSVTVTNPYKEDLQITNAGTSCGCFKATVIGGQNNNITLKTHESAQITVSMDTIKFSGDRNANLD